jgi:FtsZ-interacting cell division protein ZipA
MMSQQEFVSGQQDQQGQQPENEEEISVYPYHWAGNSSDEAAPRDEPPSSYEYEAGYQAQDAFGSPQPSLDPAGEYTPTSEYTQPAQQQMQQVQTPQYQYNPYDGDAYEQGYNPYNSSAQSNMNQQGLPPWTRPQPQARNPFRFGGILLLLILISSLTMFSHGYILYGAGHLLGLVFGSLFFPLFILMMIFGSFRRGGRGRYRRGPWGW